MAVQPEKGAHAAIAVKKGQEEEKRLVRIGQRIAERYQILALAGSGGMGKVYRALDENSGDNVAIKVLSLDASQYSRRFLREAKVMAELHHENIVAYVGYGKTSRGAPFIVMEWVAGEDLRQRMNRKKLELQEAVDIIAGVGEALHFAHRHGVIHRDLKPSNLMMVDNRIEHIKLLDFGIARWRGPAIEKMTRTGISIGTPGYMAPEQSRGESDIDGRADLYALGCVIYESLVGHRPFHGEDVVAVLARTAFDEPPRVSENRTDISDEFDDLLADMMASNVEQRPANGTILSHRARAIVSATRRSTDRIGSLGLTSFEKELLSVLLIDGDAVGDGDMQDQALEGETFKDGTLEGGALSDVSDAVQLAGGRAQLLENGTIVVILRSEDGAATDLVLRAARCALTLRSMRPGCKMSLATGQGDVSGRRSFAKMIQNAATLLRTAESAAGDGEQRSLSVRLDQTTARLLDGRFDVRRRPKELPADGADLFGDQLSFGPRLRTAQIVGRSEEISQLERVFHQCLLQRRPKLVLITGEPGIGKSHLLKHVLSSLQRESPGLQIWSARGQALAKGSAFQLLRQLLQAAVGITPGDNNATRRDKLAVAMAKYLTDDTAHRATQFLADLCDTPLEANEAHVQLRSARDGAQLMGEQGQLAWQEFLAAVSIQSPVILVLEDLQWGDMPTIHLLDSALRQVSHGQWMLVGVGRPEIEQVFPSLWTDHKCTMVSLGALDESACRQLSQTILGHVAIEDQLQHMIRLSGGNALFLEELTRAYQFSQGAQVPGTVLALAQARLRSIAPMPRQLLRAGSIFNGTFSLQGLRTLLGTEVASKDSEPALQSLVETEFLIETTTPHTTLTPHYRFRNALMREAAYSTLTDSDRELGHHLAARWLLETGSQDALLLATHFAIGRKKEEATEWFALAARQALEGNDFAAAIAHAERGIKLGAKRHTLGLLHGSIAQALLWTGENGRSSEHGAIALENLESTSRDWAQAAGDSVTALGRCGAFTDIVKIGAELVAASRARGMTGALAAAMARASSSLFLAGHFQDAEVLFREIPTDIDELPHCDLVVEGHLLSARANRFLCSGFPGHYLELSEMSAAAFGASRDRRGAALARVNVGHAYANLGNYCTAESVLRAALEVASEMDLSGTAALARYNLGKVLLSQGALDEAWDLELVAIESFALQGNDRMANGSRVCLSKIHQHKGALDLAYQRAREALHGTNTVATIRMRAHAQLASVLLDMGQPEKALVAARDAMSLLQTIEQVDEGESFVRLMLVEAEFQCMHMDRARAALESAYASLWRRAQHIGNAKARQSFLRIMRDNARIVQLANEWGLRGGDA